MVSLTFTSQANGSYTILSTHDITSATSAWTEEANSVTSTGNTSTWQKAVSAEESIFFRVRSNP